MDSSVDPVIKKILPNKKSISDTKNLRESIEKAIARLNAMKNVYNKVNIPIHTSLASISFLPASCVFQKNNLTSWQKIVTLSV